MGNLSETSEAGEQFYVCFKNICAKEELMELSIQSNRKGLAEISQMIRVRSGHSLRSVAKRMGISAAFLSDLENGHRRWTKKHVLKWKEAIK